jgi:hypothetical protein
MIPVIANPVRDNTQLPLAPIDQKKIAHLPVQGEGSDL